MMLRHTDGRDIGDGEQMSVRSRQGRHGTWLSQPRFTEGGTTEAFVRTLTVMATVLAIVVAFAQAADASNVRLNAGQILFGGQSITTGTGCSLIVQSTDGNVVEYCNGSAVWAADTAGYPGDYLYMQSDGNLVIYASNGTAIWSSATNQYSAYLQLQDDSNLVVYQGATPLWAMSWVHDAGGAQAFSQVLFVHYGWSVASQYNCLSSLWSSESGWSWNATNPSSGAYGIPQALPGSKMASSGTDWHDSGLTQVHWGEDYIAGRYGNPCGAWSHFQTYGWY